MKYEYCCEIQNILLAIPPKWSCPPEWYDAADGCDCMCGAYDSDCDDPSQQIFNCVEGQVCSSRSECVWPSELEEPWDPVCDDDQREDEPVVCVCSPDGLQ